MRTHKVGERGSRQQGHKLEKAEFSFGAHRSREPRTPGKMLNNTHTVTKCICVGGEFRGEGLVGVCTGGPAIMRLSACPLILPGPRGHPSQDSGDMRPHSAASSGPDCSGYKVSAARPALPHLCSIPHQITLSHYYLQLAPLLRAPDPYTQCPVLQTLPA